MSIGGTQDKLKVEREILIYAFRYALGRQTFAPVSVTTNISNNLDNISVSDIELFIREIEDCGYYGDECDKRHWLAFMGFLQRYLKNNRRS